MSSGAGSNSAEPEVLCTRYWVGLISSDPALPLLTPDFLRYNDIVPVHWEYVKPVILSSCFTEVVFDSGFTVGVDGDEVEFAVPVKGVPGLEVGQCNDAIGRFLEVFPNLDLKGFSTGFQGYRVIPEGCPGIINIGTSLEGQLPIIGHRSTFYFPGREVNFRVREVSRGDGEFINCLDFRTLSYYSAESFPEDVLSIVLEETLEGWEERLDEFYQLARGFYSRHIEAGDGG